MSRHPALLSRSETGLVVIDLQEKFAPVIPDFGAIVSNAVKLVLTFQMFDLPIVVTEQYPKGLGPTVEILRKQFRNLDAVEKTEFAATRVDSFSRRIAELNLKTIVVCGVETHVCINQTVHDLLNDEYNVHVIVDAVGARYGVDHEWALRKMERSGAIVGTTEMCLFELAEKAGTDTFRNISRMVKSRKNLSGAPGKAPAAAPSASAPVKGSAPAAAQPEPAAGIDDAGIEPAVWDEEDAHDDHKGK